MSGYFKRMRVDWVKETIRIYGFINREHVMRKFDVSMPQASADLMAAGREDAAIQYNSSTKRYEVPSPPKAGE